MKSVNLKKMAYADLSAACNPLDLTIKSVNFKGFHLSVVLKYPATGELIKVESKDVRFSMDGYPDSVSVRSLRSEREVLCDWADVGKYAQSLCYIR